MEDLKIPTTHQTVMPYIMVDGGDKFMEFMKTVFDAEETYKGLREDGTIMHGEVKIGDSTIMFSGCTEQYHAQATGLFIYVKNADESYARALAAGATTVNGLSDQDYGRTCGVKDPTGNTWWITSVS